jgi:membrane-bound serine protease (ClpP class)
MSTLHTPGVTPSHDRSRFRMTRALVLTLITLMGVLGLWRGLTAAAPSGDRPANVHRVQIEGVIDLGLAPLVRRAITEATEARAAALILEINTLGGRVDAAIQIRDALLDADIPTIAFVHRRAISAGALIALACDQIVMAGASTIGAAQPVLGGAPGATPQAVSEKTVSFLRKEFRATAEARKRPPLIAEAMVDADVVVEGLSEKGKLLTLTTRQAIESGIADREADSLEAVLAGASLRGATVSDVLANWAEALVRLLTHPIVSSLLMTAGLVGLITEIRTPGFGIPGAVGLTSLSLFFWGHWLVQLAGWEELLLVGLGIVLLIAEVFILPGFGIAGVLGIVALVGGLGASLVGDAATWPDWIEAAWQVAGVLIGTVVVMIILLRWLPRIRMARRLVLEDEMSAASGYASAPEHEHELLGRTGMTSSPLHPAGLATIDGRRIDVVSEGGFIDAGTPVRVVRVDGNRVVVSAAAETETASIPSNPLRSSN